MLKLTHDHVQSLCIQTEFLHRKRPVSEHVSRPSEASHSDLCLFGRARFGCSVCLHAELIEPRHLITEKTCNDQQPCGVAGLFTHHMRQLVNHHGVKSHPPSPPRTWKLVRAFAKA